MGRNDRRYFDGLGCPKDWCSANQTSSGSGHIEDFIKRLKF